VYIYHIPAAGIVRNWHLSNPFKVRRYRSFQHSTKQGFYPPLQRSRAGSRSAPALYQTASVGYKRKVKENIIGRLRGKPVLIVEIRLILESRSLAKRR
jgi:hypothetical protein